jgi:hypothetical protein
MPSGRNVDHSPPAIVEVKSKWSHTPAPTIRLRDVDREFLTYFTFVTKTLKPFLPLNSNIMVHSLEIKWGFLNFHRAQNCPISSLKLLCHIRSEFWI